MRRDARRQPVRCFIALGSNQAMPLLQLRLATRRLSELRHCTVRACSPVYRSAAVGPGRQADYLNAVIELDTRLRPRVLLVELKKLERAAGRIYRRRWTARPLDLDILLYGDVAMDTPTLTIPHPQMMARNFVLQPLLDIAPGLQLPDGSRLDSARTRQLPGRLKRIAQPLASCAASGSKSRPARGSYRLPHQPR